MPGILQEINAEIQQEKDNKINARLERKKDMLDAIKTRINSHIRETIRHGIQDDLCYIDYLISRAYHSDSRNELMREIYASAEFNEIIAKLNLDYTPIQFRAYWRGIFQKDMYLEIKYKDNLIDKFLNMF